MARQTIDFGIDLGTTNSSIAVLTKTGPTVFRNREGVSEITPSAVHKERSGAINVGRAAKAKSRVMNQIPHVSSNGRWGRIKARYSSAQG